MTKTSHTPGPWVHYLHFIVEKVDKDTFLHNDNAKYICKFGGLADKNKANARLIAAAPDLLEALEAMTKHLSLLNWGAEDYKIQSDAELAIAKARGQ